MSEFKTESSFDIKVAGQNVQVEYDGISYGIVIHFSFYGKNISRTGYKSYFLFTEDYLSMGYTDYMVCARDIAEKLYKEEKEEMSKNGVIMEQLELFNI